MGQATLFASKVKTLTLNKWPEFGISTHKTVVRPIAHFMKLIKTALDIAPYFFNDNNKINHGK